MHQIILTTAMSLTLIGCATTPITIPFTTKTILPRAKQVRPWRLNAPATICTAPDTHYCANLAPTDAPSPTATHCLLATFTRPSRPDRRLTLNVVNTPTPTDAQIILNSHRHPKAEPFNIGDDAFWHDNTLHWTNGPIYARITASFDEPASFTAATYLAIGIDKKLCRRR